MKTEEIKVYRDLMGANEEWAAKTRELLAPNRVLMLNLIGSTHPFWTLRVSELRL